MYSYEIHLTTPSPTITEWQRLLQYFSDLLPHFWKYHIDITNRENCIHYYLYFPYKLPTTVEALDAFLLRQISKFDSPPPSLTRPVFISRPKNFIALADDFWARRQQTLTMASINFLKTPATYLSTVIAYGKSSYWIVAANPEKILTIDFCKNQRFSYKKPPTFFKLDKVLKILKTTPENAIFEVPAFPYSQQPLYLNALNYSFAKHTLIVGASGSGKSKLLGLLANNIITQYEPCHIIIIDPHASLSNDLPYGQVIDFQDDSQSVNLFSEKHPDTAAATEIVFDLLYTLINHPSPNLARVLRHTVYLLLAGGCFSFANLRRLLLELEYRNDLLNLLRMSLPNNIIEFFLTDFNELRTKFYSDAISPITTFLEELALTPTFNQTEGLKELSDIIYLNNLTIFSLDRTKLGQQATVTIANLLLQQIFTLVQKCPSSVPILLFIDEVTTIKSPLLKLLLAESRKFNLHLVLATQYLGQLENDIKKAVFANVVNYYIFRVARDDADVLSTNLEVKDPHLLTKLNARECIVRLEAKEKLLPIFKAKTRDLKRDATDG